MPFRFSWRAVRAEVMFFLVVFVAFMIFRTTAYGMYHIPSESMLPTLAVGDRILVNKFSYGYSRHSMPFSIGPELTTATGRIFCKLPERGDVVVFKHPQTHATFIKRVIGLPGDVIELREGRLFINGEETPRHMEDSFRYREFRGGVARVGLFEEDLPNGRRHEIYERGDHWQGDTFGPVTVPDNNLFVMGDNRDNSLDSRFPAPGVGFLPVENLVGKAELMIFSVNAQRKEDGMKHLERKWFTPL